MNADRTINSKRNIIWGMINKIVLLLIPFIIRTILIKTLGADYLGLSSLFSSILQVLNLAELGFSSAVIFSLYKPIADGDTDTICALMNLFKRVYLVIGIIVFAIGISVSPFLPHLIKGTWPSDINIYILFYIYLANTGISYLLFGYKSALLVAHQRNDIEMKITAIVYLVQYVAQIVAVVLFRSFYMYAALYFAFTIIGNIVRSVIVDKIYPQYKSEGSLPAKQMGIIKKKVAGAFVQKLCATTRNSLDSIFISVYLGLTIVTVYGNYFYILTSVHGFLWVVANSITASVGDSIARESTEKNLYDMRKFSFIYALLAGWCTVCMLCLYQPFMKMWCGEELMFPLPTVSILCLYFYSLTMGDIRSVYTTGAGLWWEGRYRSVAETLSNVALNWILGALFGVNGIIMATVISILLINFIWGTGIIFKHYFKGMKALPFFIEHMTYGAVTAAFAAVAYILCQYVLLDGMIGILARFFIATVVVTVGIMLLCPHSKYYGDTVALIKRLLTRGNEL